MKINALNLLSVKRLDIIVKILYIESIEKNKDKDFYLNLYKKHIKYRTLGFEDHKECVEDYVESFNRLIQSIKENGFHDNSKVPINNQNEILNGAHRLACSIYFNEEMYIEVIENKESLNWDFDWFKKNNFSEEELNIILLKYLELTKEEIGCFILWAPIVNKWDEVSDKLRSQGYQLFFEQELKFEKDVYKKIIKEIYSEETGVKEDRRISEKANILSSFEKKVKLVTFSLQGKSFNEVIKFKELLRKEYSKIVNENLYITLHSSDNTQHTKELSRLLLGKNNLEYLKLVKSENISEEFMDWLKEYEAILKENSLAKENCCIVGSSSLEVLGVRKSTDIDFILESNIRKKKFGPGVFKLSSNVDLATEGYSSVEKGIVRNPLTDDEIIKDSKHHFIYRGFKFININLINERKKMQGREKDIADVKLIKSFLENNERIKKNSTDNIQDETFKEKVCFFYLKNKFILKRKTRTFLLENLGEKKFDKLRLLIKGR